MADELDDRVGRPEQLERRPAVLPEHVDPPQRQRCRSEAALEATAALLEIRAQPRQLVGLLPERRGDVRPELEQGITGRHRGAGSGEVDCHHVVGHQCVPMGEEGSGYGGLAPAGGS